MSRAHASSILKLQDVLVPTDNSTVGLWHFDKHMYSTRTNKPTINTTSLQPGKFGNSVLVQEATTNRIVVSNMESYPIGHTGNVCGFTNNFEARFGAGNWSTTIISVSDSPVFGLTKAQRIETFGNGSGGWTSGTLQATSGDTCYSMWIRLWHGTIRFGDLNTANLVTINSSNAPIGEWRYIGSENKVGSSSGTHLYANNITKADILAVQITDTKSFIPYASSSVPNQQLIYENIIPPLTVSCYFKLASTETRESGQDRVLLRYRGSNATISSWQIYIPGGSKDLYFSCRNAQQGLANKSVVVYNSNVDIYDHKWHFLCARFDGTQMTLTIDDTTKTLTDHPNDGLWTTPPIFPMQEFGIGCPIVFDRSANVYIDELRLDSITYPLEETQAWLVSGKPFYDPYDYSITAD